MQDALLESIEAGSYYEAHQRCRTLVTRSLKQRKPAQAISILTTTATALLDKAQYASGADLVKFLLQVYTDSSIAVSEPDALGRLAALLAKFPADDASLKGLLESSVTWSRRVAAPDDLAAHPAGAPEVNHLCGSVLKSLDRYKEAERYLLAGTTESARALAAMFADWAARPLDGPAGSAQMVIGVLGLRGVLEYLVMNRVNESRVFLDAFVDALPKAHISNPTEATGSDNSHELSATFYDSPQLSYLNQATLIVMAAERGPAAQDVFQDVRSAILEQGESGSHFEEMLTLVAERVFGIRARRQNNFLQDMMAQMFAGKPALH
ncbi:hypothetical protein GQ42DRAFT_161212 [Ramicandelaber brevisporus]|nr:hypothetical protein GQ42DRAFT_161212 [Ramicandelaber brevisporus]